MLSLYTWHFHSNVKLWEICFILYFVAKDLTFISHKVSLELDDANFPLATFLWKGFPSH